MKTTSRLELERWRNGETVPVEERCEMQKEIQFNEQAYGRGDGVNTPSTCSTPLTSMHHGGVNESG